MNAPTDADRGSNGTDGPQGAADGGNPAARPDGPRVTRDDIKDLSRLRRSRSDRKVVGVAAGVARHLDIDPLLVRIAFVVLTFFGGGGLILYAAAWVVVPEEDTEETVIRVDDNVRSAVLIIAAALAVASMIGDSIGGLGFPWPLAVGGLVLLLVFGGKQAKEARDATRLSEAARAHSSHGARGAGPTYSGYRPGPPPPPPAPRPTDPRRKGPLLFLFTAALATLGVGIVATLQLAGMEVAPSAYPATVLGVTGLMLLVGAFYGRAGGLIFVGLVAAAATALTAVADDIDFKGGVGQIHSSPDTAADVRDLYELGIGEIKIDLTDVRDLEELADRTLTIETGIGNVQVIVPDEGLAVRADADTTVGEIIMFGDRNGSSDRTTHGDPDTEPLLTIEAEIFVGNIEFLTEKDAA